MECPLGTPIRIWTNPNIDFVVGYARINSYIGSQGEMFRFKKTDNQAVSAAISSETEYKVSSYEGCSIFITPTHV
jgi:hypothetical protein